MSIISENELKDYDEYSNYIKYKNEKAKFNTKIASDMRHNGEVVEVLGLLKGKDIYNDRYIVRFNDDTIEDNVMSIELNFDYVKDPVEEDIRRIFSNIMKKYYFNNKEVEDLNIAISNYDCAVNEGVVFTEVKSIERLFTNEDTTEEITPTTNQLKAIAEYIRKTEKYYMPFGYEEYTEKVIDQILIKNENDITKLDFLNEIKDMVNHNISCYSENCSLKKAKKGYEKEFINENKKLILVEQMIKEEKQKDKNKNKKKER